MLTNPEQIVAQLGLIEGMRVADLGAGSGFYVKAAVKRVGHTGRVYAIEVKKDMVKRLENELKELNIQTVDSIWGDIEKRGGTKIADKTMDAVIISNVLSQVEDKLGLIDEAKRILKHRGKLLLVDWKESLGGTMHAKNYIVPEEKARELFGGRGLAFVETIGSGDHHYGIIFTHE